MQKLVEKRRLKKVNKTLVLISLLTYRLTKRKKGGYDA